MERAWCTHTNLSLACCAAWRPLRSPSRRPPRKSSSAIRRRPTGARGGRAPAPRAAPAPAAEIVIGNPQTPYTDAIAAVTKAVLEDRLGAQARTVHASGAVIFKAMDANKGDIDIDPGMQMP